VKREPQHVDQIVVYDDDPKEAGSRARLVRTLLATLVEEGVLAHEPAVTTTIHRRECLEALERDGSTILVADLMSAYDGAPRGARLLRAVRTRPDVVERTWAIALSVRSSANVASELVELAHALVVFPDSDVEPLGEAIAELLRHPPSAPQPFVVRPVDAFESTAETIAATLGADAPPEIVAAAFRWIESPMQKWVLPGPDGEPLFDGERRPDGPWASVPDVQRYLRDERGWRISTKQMERRLERRLAPASPTSLKQAIFPEAVEMALKDAQFALRDTPEQSAERLWLTVDECRVARAFLYAIELIDSSFKQPKKERERRSFDTLNTAYAHPEYERVLEEVGLDRWDTAYAIWSVADHAMDDLL
jgi:hypothetical protein